MPADRAKNAPQAFAKAREGLIRPDDTGLRSKISQKEGKP